MKRWQTTQVVAQGSYHELYSNGLNTYGNAIGVLLADALGFGLALLERVLILELATHVGQICSTEGCKKRSVRGFC